jgi:AcrR family transcriptional regulator
MSTDKIAPSGTAARGEPIRQRVLDGAERLLRRGDAEFSMRDLATEAGVSFATPFNHFGNKAAIMQALSGRRIDAMLARFTAMSARRDRTDRVLMAVDVAVAVMLEEPLVNRSVMSWIGTAGPEPGNVLAHSIALWSLALGSDDGSSPKASVSLSRQLAFAFRGVLSFWTAGEVADDALSAHARQIAASLLQSAR